jgi:hypothetical protein
VPGGAEPNHRGAHRLAATERAVKLVEPALRDQLGSEVRPSDACSELPDVSEPIPPCLRRVRHGLAAPTRRAGRPSACPLISPAQGPQRLARSRPARFVGRLFRRPILPTEKMRSSLDAGGAAPHNQRAQPGPRKTRRHYQGTRARTRRSLRGLRRLGVHKRPAPAEPETPRQTAPRPVPGRPVRHLSSGTHLKAPRPTAALENRAFRSPAHLRPAPPCARRSKR